MFYKYKVFPSLFLYFLIIFCMIRMGRMNKILISKRKEAGFTQEDMSRLLNISLRHYKRIESGIVNCSVVLALNISKLLNTSVEDLFSSKSITISEP